VSLERLESEITELAAHIHAATCRWLCLVAEFDRREGWAQWGCRSCAEWVSWRCALAPVAAREHVRVARRLQELPLVRGAFSRGQLSYSKVRALARLETVEREADLLELARIATAAQLERLVRGYRGVVAVERAAAEGAHRDRLLDWDYEEDGFLTIRGRLPAEDGAVVVAALEAARATLLRDAEGDSAESPAPTAATQAHDSAESPVEAPEPLGARNADALVVIADTLLSHGPANRSGGDRCQVVVHVDADALREPVAGGRCELDGGPPLAAETARRLACDASLVAMLETRGRPLGVGRKTRAIPPALRRALRSRDGGCRFPGCQRRRGVDAHHIEHWAHGGPTDLANLVQLCRHHHRLVHEGGYGLERRRGGQLVFRRSDGRRIPAVPPPDQGDHGVLRARHHRQRLSIGPGTCVPGWSGERLDPDLGVDALLAFAPPPTIAEPA
jgi:hypothetical protein